MSLVMKFKKNDRTMLCVFQLIVVLLALVTTGSADDAAECPGLVPSDEVEDNAFWDDIPQATPNYEEATSMPESMAHAMAEFITAAERAQKMARDGVLTQEETEAQYVTMVHLLRDIFGYMYTPNNAYSFLNAKGVDTIIAKNLYIPFSELRSLLLQLLKALFDLAPTTTLNVIPDTVLDRLVDIYEQDENLDIKVHAIEILSVWLPGNPQAQTRVMKMKGLVPFYKPLAKMDPLLVRPTLELFNKILNEHITVRNKKLQKNKADYATFQQYQQMGLIERLSTPMLCNGLLKIFEAVFSTDSPNMDVLPSILRLLQVIKPHCSRVYNGRTKVIKLIEKILGMVQDPSIRIYLEGNSMNVTEVIESLTEFVELLNSREHEEL